MNPNLECCISGCHTRPNQGLRLYRFPCHNPQISSIWEQRICQPAKTDFNILNDHVCELHFDHRCKTGNECALEEGSLPTLHLPSFGNLSYTDSAFFQMSTSRIEEPSYTISMETLPDHCRFCLRRGLLYEVEAFTYKCKSFLSFIDLPSKLFPDNTQPNACLTCLKSIVIAHQLSVAVEHSNTILQQLLQRPKQIKVISNTNFLDIKSELAFFNLIQASSLSIKLEIEFEDNMVCANEDYEQKWVTTGETTTSDTYVNSQNMVEKSCVTKNQDNVSKMHDSITLDKKCQKEFSKSYKIGAIRENTSDFSAEEIYKANENSDSCVLMENTVDNAEVMISNYSDDSCAHDRQFDNEQSPESFSKAEYEPAYKCELCKFITNNKSNLEIHKKQHFAGNDSVHFYCKKCEKYFLLRRHFMRHNTIVHAGDFTFCAKPNASARKQAFHYMEHYHFQCDISSRELRLGHWDMLDHKQGHTTFAMTDKNTHWNENEGVYVCPTCDWRNLSLHTFNAHLGKHVQSVKGSTIGLQELETLKTVPERYTDGRYQRSECQKTFIHKCDFIRHGRIHSNERPNKCIECPKTEKNDLSRYQGIHANKRTYNCIECLKTFSQKSNFNTHKRIHKNERPYKCTECPKAFTTKSHCDIHKRIHTNERPYNCSECPKTFSDKSNFDTHKRIHTNERPFKCAECPKTFKQKSNLDTHTKIHTNERPYKCTGCPKAFITKSHCDRHKRIHTNERPYKCTECPKAFIQQTNLSRHQRTHRNERPYKCTHCSKTFSRKCEVDVHRRIHTNERPYKCTDCSKTFSDNRNFSAHRRIHTNAKPYKCTECSKTFSSKSNLERHVLSKHPDRVT